MQAAIWKMWNQFFGLSLIALASCTSSGPSKVSWDAPSPFAGSSGLSVTPYSQKIRSEPWSLVFVGNVNGEIDLCGCAMNPKGGLERRLNFIKKLPVNGRTLIVDAGNSLFANKSLDVGAEAGLKARAAALIKAQKDFGVEVQNVGLLDLSAGSEFLRAQKAALTWVSLSWVDAQGRLVFEREYVRKLEKGPTLRVVGISAGGDSAGVRASGLTVRPALAALQDYLKGVAREDIVVVLSDLGENEDKALVDQIERPLVFVQSRDLGSLEYPMISKSSVFFRTNIQGQQWGQARFVGPEALPTRGFYNSDVGDRFAARWDSLIESRKAVLSKASSSDRQTELNRLDQVAADMLVYAPGRIENKIVFEYALVNLLENFSGTNSLTPVQRAFKKSR